MGQFWDMFCMIYKRSSAGLSPVAHFAILLINAKLLAFVSSLLPQHPFLGLTKQVVSGSLLEEPNLKHHVTLTFKTILSKLQDYNLPVNMANFVGKNNINVEAIKY